MRMRSQESEPMGKAVPRSGMRGAQAARRRAMVGMDELLCVRVAVGACVPHDRDGDGRFPRDRRRG